MAAVGDALARRMKDKPRAQLDIGEALKLSADDASVQLERGQCRGAGGRCGWREEGVGGCGEDRAGESRGAECKGGVGAVRCAGYGSCGARAY